MTFEELNAKVLSTGQTRKERVEELMNWYSQGGHEYYGNFRCFVDIPYDTQSERQKFNVYAPMQPGRHPTIVYVHGGAWFAGDRADHGVSMVLPLIAHGYTVLTIGYRFVDEAVFPDMIYDVMHGMEAAFARADEFEIDPDNLCAIGGSAGTNMCLLPALWSKRRFKACVLRCAILDLATIRSDFEKIGLTRRKNFGFPDEDTCIESLFIGGSLSEEPEKFRQANPANYLDENSPDFLILHGLDDRATPYLQSVAFAEAAEKVLGKEHVTLHLYPDTKHDHGFYDDPSVFEEIVEFLNKRMK